MLKKHQYYGFILPAVAFIIGIIIIPFISGIIDSFTNPNGISRQFIGLKNYQLLFQDYNFLQSFWLTFKFSVVSVVLINLVGLVFALIVTHKDNWFNNTLKTIFFIPNLVGGVLLGFIWQFIFTNAFKALSVNLGQNWLNGWLSDETTGFWGLVI